MVYYQVLTTGAYIELRYDCYTMLTFMMYMYYCVCFYKACIT